jgi:hypothetical protein
MKRHDTSNERNSRINVRCHKLARNGLTVAHNGSGAPGSNSPVPAILAATKTAEDVGDGLECELPVATRIISCPACSAL